jgi:hypothetical protein
MQSLPGLPKDLFDPPATYRELKALEHTILIPDLMKIVVDYAIEVKDYTELQKAFVWKFNQDHDINEYYYIDDINEETRGIQTWRTGVLHSVREEFIKYKTLAKCHKCRKSFYCHSIDDKKYCMDAYDGSNHTYYICLLCDYYIYYIKKDNMQCYECECILDTIGDIM